jgi:hypothetical protein
MEPRPTSPPPPPRDQAPAAELPPAAEALRAEIAAGRKTAGGDFADWRRSRQGGRAFAWLMTFILLSPGLFCFLYQAPTLVSAGVEACGIAANWWLRRARKKHLKDIAAWQAPGEGL